MMNTFGAKLRRFCSPDINGRWRRAPRLTNDGDIRSPVHRQLKHNTNDFLKTIKINQDENRFLKRWKVVVIGILMYNIRSLTLQQKFKK